MIYKRRPDKVEATQWFALGDHDKVNLLPNSEVGWLPTDSGGQAVHKGDWIVEDAAGGVFVMKDREFRLTYIEVKNG